VSLFVEHEFSLKSDNKPHLEFYMKKVITRIYRTILRMLGLKGGLPTLGLLESIDVLVLRIVLGEGYGSGILQI
jgi:hypothetical protein